MNWDEETREVEMTKLYRESFFREFYDEESDYRDYMEVYVKFYENMLKGEWFYDDEDEFEFEDNLVFID